MSPRRFRLKVADHMGFHGDMNEERAINNVAMALGWLDKHRCKTDTAPKWLYKYRKLVSFRDINLSMASKAQADADKCSEKLEALIDAHA